MLTLTAEAVSAIRAIIADGGLPEQSALRISTRAPENGSPAFALTIEVNPRPEDHVVEAPGARVYVDPDVAPALADKELDAQVTGDGNVQFVLSDHES